MARSKELDFLISAFTEQNQFMPTAHIGQWLAMRRRHHAFHVRQIPLAELDQWSFERSTGNLIHHSGKFFTIEGIWIETNFGPISQWSQPIINQPEIGLLGFLTKKIDGILYFLMQAKMEPGNINILQLAPTVQATRSNYTRVHQGKTPPYLEYFLDRSDSKVLVDVLQSEQGARFLRKRNRNMIIETTKEVPVLDDYCWLTLGQIHKLVQRDNLVNMDARTVLSCIPFMVPEFQEEQRGDVESFLQASDFRDLGPLHLNCYDFRKEILRSALNNGEGLHDLDTIISWFTERKVRYELNVERIPLKFVQQWYKTEQEILHEEGKYFSIIAISVEADSREVSNWTQPIIKPLDEGIVAYLVKNIDGVLHFLVQAKVESGNFDIVEMAPTVQCITGSYQQASPQDHPPFLDYVLNASESQICLASWQSEEGGRFFQEQNRNIVIQVEDDFPLSVPENYIWMTLNQIKQFIKYDNFVNVEGRCLLASLGFI